MTKAEMKRAAFAVSADTANDCVNYVDLSNEFNVRCKDIDETNPRFCWILSMEMDGTFESDFLSVLETELVEASMLLSEACS